MDTSGPVRILEPEHSQGEDDAQFGLDQSRLSVVLFAGDRPVLGAHFGARNPDGMLQYMRVDGQRELFLMSRFVGEEWEAAALGG
ncbi:MAG TPA: hypothetical protein VFB54_09790 [Burkholderiales bacterium]|nr:hypothetical protein [Burkholderiales bacterium]